MGYEAVAWVLVYIAAFGVSDTLVAIAQPTPEWALVYYTLIGLAGARILVTQTANTDSNIAGAVEPAAVL